MTYILGARGQAVISDFQRRSGRSAKNSSTRTIEKIVFFAKKNQKSSGTVSEGMSQNIAKLASPGQCDFRKNAKS